MWRPFTRDPHFVIRDRALAVEGKHTLSVRARAASDYETTDVDGVAVEVNVDSVAPHIDATSLVRIGDELVVTATDAVSDEAALQFALSSPAAAAPATAFAASLGHLAIGDAERLAVGGNVKLYVRDEAGNVATSVLSIAGLFGPQAPLSETGGCAVGGGGDGVLGVLLVFLVFGLLAARRRRAWLLALLVGGCSTSKLAPIEPMAECTMDVDCASKCTNGQVGVCGSDMTCSCSADIAVGSIGTYASLAVGPSGTAWVSAYNATHGDLMVAQAPATGRVPDASWEFADGVPSGPVVLPASHVRGGIRANGDDVGLYTSIALTPAGDPVVAYYDRTHAGLRFAQRTRVRRQVDELRARHRRPGHEGHRQVHRHHRRRDGAARDRLPRADRRRPDGSGHSEVRFLLAGQAPQPATQADWTQIARREQGDARRPTRWLDDVPDVCGLFVASAARSTGTPIVAYYDRPGGTFKLAEHDAAAGAFKKPVVIDGGGRRRRRLVPVDDGLVGRRGPHRLRRRRPPKSDGHDLPERHPGGRRRRLPRRRHDRRRAAPPGLPPRRRQQRDRGRRPAVTAIVYQDATTQDLLFAVPGTPGKRGRTRRSRAPTALQGRVRLLRRRRALGGQPRHLLVRIEQMTSDKWVEVFRQKMQ